MDGMKRMGRGRDWKVYRGGGRPATAESEPGDDEKGLLDQASDPLAIAQGVLRDLRTAEKGMIRIINQLRYGDL
jgi:hypothetical protein